MFGHNKKIQRKCFRFVCYWKNKTKQWNKEWKEEKNKRNFQNYWTDFNELEIPLHHGLANFLNEKWNEV